MVWNGLPADAERVKNSTHAKLVTVDAVRSIVGIINRDSPTLPLLDKRAREALNLAIDRDTLVQKTMFGYASPLAGLAPPTGALQLDKALHPFFRPYAHDPKEAAKRWQAADNEKGVVIRIAAPEELEPIARQVGNNLEAALGVAATLQIYRSSEEKLDSRRKLASRVLPREWDILIHEQGAQEADGVALEMHRAFVGALGEWRAGPVIAEFEEMFAKLRKETSRLKAAQITHELDEFVREEALLIFLCAPQALYAVNKEVDFTAYSTTFELPECKVSAKHWSRR